MSNWSPLKRLSLVSYKRPLTVGSMDYIRAKKGVILTTSQFTKEALDFVDRIEGKKVVLIDGAKLTTLMIEHNVGVTTSKLYELKEVSNDFFDEDEG
jgi:restriction system protein